MQDEKLKNFLYCSCSNNKYNTSFVKNNKKVGYIKSWVLNK